MSLLLIPKTVAVVTVPYNIDALATTFVANGLAGTESITFGISSDDGVTFSPLLDYSTGTPIKLDATHNVVVIPSSGKFQLTKSITAVAVGLAVSTVAVA